MSSGSLSPDMEYYTNTVVVTCDKPLEVLFNPMIVMQFAVSIPHLEQVNSGDVHGEKAVFKFHQFVPPEKRKSIEELVAPLTRILQRYGYTVVSAIAE